jgi:hypothetical protein
MVKFFYSTVIGQGENKSFIQSETGENYCGAWAGERERESERKGRKSEMQCVDKMGFWCQS